MDAEYDTGKVTGINNGEGPDKDWEFFKEGDYQIILRKL